MPRIALLCLLAVSIAAKAQYKADNVTYTTVFPEELCKVLLANQGYHLLDVRSQGEVDDTSSAEGLNIGHIKNSLHIDIRELPRRWRELLAYKDQPLFIYCSHSQRSRRASRLLADSGFTKVFNINGGLTNFYNQGIESNSCQGLEIVTSVPYKIVSAREAIANMKQGKSYTLVDIRDDSVYAGISSDEELNAEGRLPSAVHLPWDKFSGQTTFSFPAGRVLLIDAGGDISPKAAKLLIEKGYKDVSILFDGMEGWVDYVTNNPGPLPVKWTTSISYKLLSADDFNKMVAAKTACSLIDVRTPEEFSNTAKNYWQNIGQIRGAINIPASELKTSNALPQSKTTPVIVYGFNGNSNIFSSARWLREQGYSNVSVLQGGIWALRWTSHNIKGKAALNDLVVNVPPVNL